MGCKMNIHCDMDGILCTIEDNYADAKPIQANIDRLNKLYKEGNQITIFTARGRITGVQWAETTLEQLNEWGVKFHYLNMNKPAYDLIIDDRAENWAEV